MYSKLLLFSGGKSSADLQAADVIIISRNTCLTFYQDLTESMICAGYYEGGIDACQVSGTLLLKRKFPYGFFVSKMYLLI